MCLFAGDAETIPGVSGNEDVSTGVETDGLVPLAGEPQHNFPEAVHSPGRSQKLLEQAFDDGSICVRMRNLLVLFHVDYKLLPLLCLIDQFVTDPADTVTSASGHQMVFLCPSVCEEEKAQLLSPLMKS